MEAQITVRLPSSTASIGLSAKILHVDMLDVRLADVTLCVGCLDIVIEQFVAEVGEVVVRDFNEVIVRLLVTWKKVIDFTGVGGRRIQSRTRTGQDFFGHIQGDPRSHFTAAGVGLVLVARQWIVAVVVDADL